MKFNRFNQLEIEETDEPLDEQFSCPDCSSLDYSSIYMEKISSTNPIGNTLTNDAKFSRIFYCKCSCGKYWLENYIHNHHRPHIRYIFMRSYQNKNENNCNLSM